MQQIRTTLEGRNRELLCRNCGRLGDTHIWFTPHHCRAYEDEKELLTTFEAVVEISTGLDGRNTSEVRIEEDAASDGEKILSQTGGNIKIYSPAWVNCCSAANRLADLVCIMYHPRDEKARLTFPTATWAEIIAAELGIEVPRTE